MDNSFWKRGTSCILALFLACLMVSSSFVGTLDPTYMSTPENVQPLGLEEEIVVSSLEDIPLRNMADLVYDSESDRAIFFGGATDRYLSVEFSDTWSYDYNTNRWTEMSPAIHPPASNVHQMTYHSGQDKVVLFGGHVSGSGLGDLNHDETWTYDYNTDTWTNMNPATSPPPMSGGSMEYDSESDLIVLVGGWPDGGMSADPLAETWTYDLTSNTWTNVTTGVQPSVRAWVEMTYDTESDIIVLFGGFEMEPEPWKILNDTWTYDANTNTWTEIVTDGPNITGELVYDSESDRVVFYGGAAHMLETVEYLRSETWSYDTNTETWEMIDTDVEPTVRARGELIYDSESDKIIVYSGIHDGGHATEVVLGDCWAYDLNNNLWNNVNWDWQEMTPTVSPEPLGTPAMAYDSESDLVVMFGGNTEGSGILGENETWSYDFDTNSWTNMSPSLAPPLRWQADMVYDVESDILILFGGSYGEILGFAAHNYNDTWAYDLNTNTWTNMSPVVAPCTRWGHSMTYDTKLDRVILFGGENDTSFFGGGGTNFLNDTWMYDYNTNTWTLMQPAIRPSARVNHALAYDEESEMTVLFGGSDDIYHEEIEDTWVYNSSANTWNEMDPSHYPSNRTSMKAVYDSSVDRIIMFGGVDYGISPRDFDETWSYDYDTNTWFEMNTPSAPSERQRSGLAFDSESNRTILFGGDNSNACCNETWAYRYQINAPPPPENLVVTESGRNLVLTWDDSRVHPSTPLTGYNVYRGSTSGVYTLLAELGNVTTYTDTSPPEGVTTYYVVTAETSLGESDYSEEDSGFILYEYTPDDGVYTFIAYGDSRSSDATSVSSEHYGIVCNYLKEDPEMILHTGDLVNHGGEAYQWPLFEASISLVGDADIPFYSVAGNHEWYTDVWGVNDEDYSTYLDYCDSSTIVDTPGLYYSFNWENIHFIVLNTVETWAGDDYECPTAQMDWLEADLAANDLEFIIVSFHNPMYSVRADRPDRWAQAESLREEFQTLFENNGVDIVFNGHDHHYYRTVRNGIQYIVTGGGGAPLYDIQTTGTVWQPGDRGFKAYHYLKCSVGDFNATANQLSVDVVLLDGTVVDSFELVIPLPPPTTTPTPTPTPTPTQLPFPMVMTLVILGGAGAVIVVIVLVVRKSK